MPTDQPQILPRTGSAREKLRSNGQFWTPAWTADIMAAYALQDRPASVLDPAMGNGAFFRAAIRYANTNGFKPTLYGRDIDPTVIEQAKETGLSAADLANVELRDFVLDPPRVLFPAIIANPPYIRHHRLDAEQKLRLANFARTATGRRIDGRAGLHVYFLIRALQSLAPGGRLAYIVSADICEGVFANALWEWICANFRLDAVLSFAAEATPFPEVDTNAVLFLITRQTPVREFLWAKILRPEFVDPTALVSSSSLPGNSGIQIFRRSLSEGLAAGLSRAPSQVEHSPYCLGDFASVMRGIVTGDNDFFFMTKARASELGIPENMMINAVGRMRDVLGERFCRDDLARLEDAGRPTRLLNVNGVAMQELHCRVREYLERGVAMGLPEKTLIKTRNPWYRMERRNPPPIFFAYLGRRSARFIRNYTDAVPLTCLLCVYPKQPHAEFLECFWRVISHQDTIANLKRVGKSYGGDAIKVEPRALERLPLPAELVRSSGLAKFAPATQGLLDIGQDFFVNMLPFNANHAKVAI